MQTVSRSSFTTVTTEGAILPADLLQRIVDGRELEGLRPVDYHLAPNERLNEAISRSWNRLLGVWESFEEQMEALPEDDRGTTLTRERWLLILFQELGYGRLPFQGSLSVNGQDEESAKYPISHEYDRVPIHLVSLRQPLDRTDADRGERFRRSPHSLLQEFVNRSDRHLWGIVSNGLRLRLLRDNVSFTRAAYLEFDLEAMMAGELYADFTLLWLTAHQSRLEGAPETCWLEQWSQEAAEQGTRALDSLRDGVQEAISILGRGFLAHPANGGLRRQLQSGDLDAQDYYRQLLRLVYRLIFLFVAEDRNLLLLKDADAATREQYYSFYSVTRLRELAARRRSGPHPDLYRSLRLVMILLREGYSDLGLPALGSYLFSDRSTPLLDEAEIANERVLDAIRALAFTVEDRVLRPVDYKNLGAEELGSVYESLLELHPELNVTAATFDLNIATGSERRTTGSYYTPTSLINSLLDTALEPVVTDRLRGKKGQEAEGALLDIKVVDPAAGSGHFLIAAANRLARHLARIRTGDEEPSPEAAREALRDVVRHCIYGVDINEMAVELCKVGLWLETLDPGKPLSFLDANIQQGNSLVGATPALLEDGIPDEAFTPVTGDNKAYAREFKALNREQRKGQMALFKGGKPWQRLGNLAEALREMVALEGDTLEGVRAQEEAYAALVRSQGYQYGKLWADAWCAAFFWPLRPEKSDGFPYPVTEEEFRRIEHNPHSIPSWMRQEIEQLALKHHFFHWHMAFPHIFRPSGNSRQMDDEVTGWRGGFDVVLGNPPWERIKLQEKEWFAARSPEIANARNAAQRKKMIQSLKKSDPTIHAAFMQDKAAAENESIFLRNSGLYPLCGRGDVNTYQVFAELSRMALDSRGRTGLVLPTGIATDYYTQDFFRDLMQKGSLVSLYDFENRERIFPDVASPQKFCLLTLTGLNFACESADFVFFATRIEHLTETERHFTLSSQEVALLNPNTKTCPIFRSKRDAELTKAIYRRIPVLVEEGPPERNSWGVTFSTMFHMSGDSELFRTYEQLESEGWMLNGSVFQRGNEQCYPLYEAKMFHHFNHRYNTYEGVPAGKRFRVKAQALSLEGRLNIPSVVPLPRYWVHSSHVESAWPWEYEWAIAFRDITNVTTNRRTAIFSMLPKSAVSHPSPLLIPADATAREVSGLYANLTSFAFDYTTRQTLGGSHLTYYILKQLPVLPQSTYYQDEILPVAEPLIDWIVRHVLELTYTTYDLQAFARDIGYHGPPYRWNEERRLLLRCELDAVYFHLYGIQRDDVAYIMDTFPIVRRKEEDEYGEYRAKRVILEIYDEMAEAMATGTPYQTRLDPPPAHPDAAHPWDEEYLGPELPRDKWWQEGKQVKAREGQQPKKTYTSSSTRTVVKEPAPTFELKSPSAKRPQRETPAQKRPEQPALVADFTPPQGSRSQRLKQVMALGDRVKSNRQDAAGIAQLVAALGDEDESIRWLASSALGLLGGATVVHTLAAFLEQAETPEAREEAIKALQRIVDNPREDEEVRKMAESAKEKNERASAKATTDGQDGA